MSPPDLRTLIDEVLLAHRSMCLDNGNERAAVATALTEAVSHLSVRVRRSSGVRSDVENFARSLVEKLCGDRNCNQWCARAGGTCICVPISASDHMTALNKAVNYAVECGDYSRPPEESR